MTMDSDDVLPPVPGHDGVLILRDTDAHHEHRNCVRPHARAHVR